MKITHVLLIIVLSLIFSKVATANWYDTHIALKIAVNCSDFVKSNAEADSLSRDDSLRAWILSLNEKCEGRSMIEYPHPISFRSGCEIVNASPTGAFVIYNDLFDISHCGNLFG